MYTYFGRMEYFYLCLTKSEYMKKMLAWLFLLFSLSTVSLTGGDLSDKTSAWEVKTDLAKVTIIKMADNVKKESKEAYQYWDRIPIYSPINLHELRKISSDYGIRKHPIHNVLKKHKGIDFVASVGTDIRSTADGIVEFIGKNDHGYGNQIIICHSNGYKTRYAHLKSIGVKVGDSIKAKEKIGELGATGTVTGAHLHYEVIKNGIAIDPMKFTYCDYENRSIQRYYNYLIALETNELLGMYHQGNLDRLFPIRSI